MTRSTTDPTPAALAALERLAKAATPGPWRTVTNRPFGPWDNRDGEPLASDGLPVLVRNWKEVCLNAAFIVALVNAFPALLAAARRGAGDTEDAERYRWLRERLEVRGERTMGGTIRSALTVITGCAVIGDGLQARTPDELDAALDTARAAHPEEPQHG